MKIFQKVINKLNYSLGTLHLVIGFLLLAVKRPSASVSTAEKFIAANKPSALHKSETPRCSAAPQLVCRHEVAVFEVDQKACL